MNIRSSSETGHRLYAVELDHEVPKLVVLCGSTRFHEAFTRANYEETMAGHIVLSVGFFVNSQEQIHRETTGCTPAQKLALDELHKRKIDLADEVLVLNVDGYVGPSTRSEVAYAVAHGKPLRWLEHCTCGALGVGDDGRCEVCHRPINGHSVVPA